MSLSRFKSAAGIFLAALPLVAFGQTNRVIVRVENTLDIARTDETVSIPWANIVRRLPSASAENVRVVDAGTGREIPSQVFDVQADGKPDELLFQASLWPGEERAFAIEPLKPGSKPKPRTYAAHMDPNGRDDIAWENDRIAFRAYGMGLQKLENLVSNGIDVWTKRTPNLVIQKWYAKKAPQNYHTDTGEGADFYKVGPTLGAGGTGIWHEGKLHRFENFASYRVITTGPIRSVFELEFKPMTVGGVQVTELKRIAIDAGQHVYRQESTFRYQGAPLTFATGVVKREGLVGATRKAAPWSALTAWGPVDRAGGGHGDLGHVLLVEKARLAGMTENDDHYLILFTAGPGEPVATYNGFGWTAAGDFDSSEEWQEYVDAVARRLASPVKVTVVD